MATPQLSFDEIMRQRALEQMRTASLSTAAPQVPTLDDRSPTTYTMDELQGMSEPQLKAQLDALKVIQEHIISPSRPFTADTVNIMASSLIVRGNYRALLFHLIEKFEANNFSQEQKRLFRLPFEANIAHLDRHGVAHYTWPAKVILFDQAPIAELAKIKGYALPIAEIERLRIANHESELMQEVEHFEAMLKKHGTDLETGLIRPESFAKVALTLIAQRHPTTRGNDDISAPTGLSLEEENLMRYLWDPRVPSDLLSTLQATHDAALRAA